MKKKKNKKKKSKEGEEKLDEKAEEKPEEDTIEEDGGETVADEKPEEKTEKTEESKPEEGKIEGAGEAEDKTQDAEKSQIDDLFGGDEKNEELESIFDNLGIDKEAEEAPAESPEQELLRYKKANSKLEKLLAALKDENTTLKFERMELQEEVETLKDTIEEMKLTGARKTVDYPKGSDGDESEVSLSPGPPDNHRRGSIFGGPYQPQYSQPQQQDYSYEKVKQDLEKWKHWDLDMRHWRSVGSGPVVQF